MPKIIVRCNFLDGAPAAHLANLVEYVGTRAGVERIDESKRNLPATKKQQDLVFRILQDIPGAKFMHEYRDYYLSPTRANASEFISSAIEQNLNMVATQENYVDYIANRPRVERIGEHGLFTDAGEAVVLSKVQEEVAGREGRLWTHVISLRREDAARLGYDEGKRWRTLLRSKRALLSEVMDIPAADLKWYAAFHNEGHHPHVHLMAYSTGSGQGYMNKEGIHKLRSQMAHEIFKQDFEHIYKAQKDSYTALRGAAEERVRQLAAAAREGVCQNPEVAELLLDLGGRLQNTKGKKTYGFLKADLKAKVDAIVDLLAKEPGMTALYQAWHEWQGKIRALYTNDLPPPPPMREAEKIKPIKNLIIREADRLGQNLPVEGAHEAEPEAEAPDGSEPEAGAAPGPVSEEPPSRWVELPQEVPAPGRDEAPESDDAPEVEEWVEDAREQAAPSADWSDDYRDARKALYATGDGRDLPLAFQLFQMEAFKGNALAMHDLARMYGAGLGCDADAEAADAWYRRALDTFLTLHRAARGRRSAYLAYRIGKLYAAGLGCRQDHTAAARYLEEAAGAGNQYARYTLAGLYQKGQGVDQDLPRARALYEAAAEDDFPYASYELYRMCRDGVGGAQDTGKAKLHATAAFEGFRALEEQSHEDRLQYRLGCMLLAGEGAEPDADGAAWYLRQSAEAGNPHAAYRLAKLYLGQADRNEELRAQAVALLEQAAGAKNSQAQYALGRLLLRGEGTPQDIPRALALLEAAAEGGQDYAAYALGRHWEERGDSDGGGREQAEAWYGRAAGQGNHHAAYRLARLCLEGGDAPRRAQGLKWLEQAAEAGNPSAQYTRAKLMLEGELAEGSAGSALALLEQAAAQSTAAAYLLGTLCERGEGVERDPVAAARWLEQAAAGEHPAAATRLSALYLREYPDDAALEARAVALLREAAGRGDPRGQYALAKLCQEGRLVARDTDGAVGWLGYAAELGNEYAQLRLGKLLLAGDEVRRDIPQALYWLSKAAGAGNPYAQCALASAYLDPTVGPGDPWRARELLEQAAQGENASAQYRLARMLLSGTYFDPEPERAVLWLNRAAGGGHIPATRTLGMLCVTGAHAPADTARGLMLLTRAAAGGDNKAQYQLGKLLLLGQLAPRDLEGARHWLERSAAGGNGNARFLLDHFQQFQGTPAALAATRLLHHLSRIIDDTHLPPPGGAQLLIDSKRRRKLREKQRAAGHAQDDSQEALHR